MCNEQASLERQLKRQALQLTAMLPDDPDAAIKVLSYAYELVEKFVRPQEVAPCEKATGCALRLVVSQGAPVKP